MPQWKMRRTQRSQNGHTSRIMCVTNTGSVLHSTTGRCNQRWSCNNDPTPPRAKSNLQLTTEQPGTTNPIHRQWVDCHISPRPNHLIKNDRNHIQRGAVSGKTVSWGLELLHYPLCLQRSDTEEE